ncbi:hypothetical protein EMN47_16700 [Prolixibacteraceae bacterium JC049]|nr:hypothetical protein [Prolixibacteraceae bacterium JC049]
MKQIAFLIICLLLVHSTYAQLSGGGDLNPEMSAPKKTQEKWMDLRIGLSVHWGPSALGGKEISWSRHSIIPKEKYDNFYKEFAPEKFNAEEWAKLMKRWGVKYMAPTGKHHDGFCLWFSDYTTYDMENAKLKVDIMQELAKACKKHGIMLGSYYSNLDWYHPDWYPYLYGGPGPLFEKKSDSPNLERYFKFFEDQVVELITKYDLDFLQFDGEWDSTYTHEVGSRLYKRFHEVKPEILLSSRIDIGRRSAGNGNHLNMDGKKYCGDYQERERVVNHGNNVIAWLDHPWQAWVTIDKTQWSYNPKPDLMNVNDLIIDLVSVVGNNGNYMINLGPRPDGSFDAEQIALMDEMGKWLKKYGKAIYGTRGGPFYPFPEGVSTRKGKKAWLFITDSKTTKIVLPNVTERLLSAKVFGKQQHVNYNVEKGFISFDLPQKQTTEPVRIIELKFDKKVEMSKVKHAPNQYEISGAKRTFKDVDYQLSSRDPKWNDIHNEKSIFNEAPIDDYAFHTKSELNPYISIDLNKQREVHGLIIKNRPNGYQKRTKGLTVWLSNDGKQWKEYWKTDDIKSKYNIPFSSNKMGATVAGKTIRYIKIGVKNKTAQPFHLNKIEIYCKE